MKRTDYYEVAMTAENRIKARERKARLAAIDAKYAAEYPSMVKGQEKRECKGRTFTTRGRCGGGSGFHKSIV